MPDWKKSWKYEKYGAWNECVVFQLQQISVNRWVNDRKHNYTEAKGKYLIEEDQVKFHYRKIIKVNRTGKTGSGI